MKKIVRNISLLLSIVATILLCSCVKFNFRINSNINKIEDNNVKLDGSTSKNANIGDELISLDDATTLSKYELPKVGDSLYGFNVKGIYDYSNRNAKVVLFEHEKTSAKAFLISNDDIDKAACIGFNTLAYDDKGVPHVFEHSCLGGSDKYPSANLFTEAVNRTYNTYMNAVTLQNATIYPMSSLSDEQLFSIYKLYLDGVFYPNVLKDKKNLEREAYRYILYDESDDINLSGVVYSEMSGFEGSIDAVAYYNSLKTMFDGSYLGSNTGGDTKEIPNIDIEDLIKFHEKYYHPSNMVLTLYGDIDYKKYLQYTDEEYLSHFDKIAFYLNYYQ